MRRRVAEYQRSGVRLVWVIDPEERDVTVYRSGKEDQVLDSTQIITGEDVLPEFSCPVAEFFFMAGSPPQAASA